ncbi:MAG: hypothetical protein AMK70_09385 [Nitrospira bacterium SG8_35_1]|nr:MAG: hypothetical protein AMK70_09385 [Nitrospira bacterium SG8_35_1]
MKILHLISEPNVESKNLFSLSGNNHGMSVTELMVAICIVAIVAAAAIPSYISYVQQARVVSLIIPRLHLIETNISYFYSLHDKLPGSSDIAEILKDIDAEDLDIALTNGTVALTIKAGKKSSKLHILDGKILVASPIITEEKIVGWHLAGELADRLGINY